MSAAGWPIRARKNDSATYCNIRITDYEIVAVTAHLFNATLLMLRSNEEFNFTTHSVPLRESSVLSDAEGATAPETLRPKNRKGRDSGERRFSRPPTG
jgi:hypothetical protein